MTDYRKPPGGPYQENTPGHRGAGIAGAQPAAPGRLEVVPAATCFSYDYLLENRAIIGTPQQCVARINAVQGIDSVGCNGEHRFLNLNFYKLPIPGYNNEHHKNCWSFSNFAWTVIWTVIPWHQPDQQHRQV